MLVVAEAASWNAGAGSAVFEADGRAPCGETLLRHVRADPWLEGSPRSCERGQVVARAEARAERGGNARAERRRLELAMSRDRASEQVGLYLEEDVVGGEAAVDRYDGIPPYPETRDYVSRVLAGASRLGGPTRTVDELDRRNRGGRSDRLRPKLND